jgi:hypothetical protein
MNQAGLFLAIRDAIRFIVRRHGVPDQVVTEAAMAATEKIVAYSKSNEEAKTR